MTLERVDGNEVIYLDDETFPVLRSGEVAVFGSPTAGEGKKQLRFLFSLRAGDAVAPVTQGGTAGLELLPITLTPVEIERVPRAAVLDDEALLTTWVGALTKTLDGRPGPISLKRIPLGESTELPGTRGVQVGDPLGLLSVQEGKLRFLGDDDLLLEPGHAPVLLGGGAWADALERSEVSALAWKEIPTEERALALRAFERSVLNVLTVMDRLDREVHAVRFRERERRAQEATADALDELTAILNPDQPQLLESDSPLLVAASAVGLALGVEIRPPVESCDERRLRHPLDAIAQASRLRTRSVILRPGWWLEDGAPFLAYRVDDDPPQAEAPPTPDAAAGATDTKGKADTEPEEKESEVAKRPVALLPDGKGNYDLFDPRDGSRRRLTSSLADELHPEAWALYRPLPYEALKVVDLLRFSARGRGRDLRALLLCATGVTLFGMFPPIATGIMIDSAIPDGNTSLLYWLGFLMFGAALASAALQLAQGFANIRLQAGTDHDLQAGLWDRLLHLRMSFFRQFTSGDLTDRVRAVEAIRAKLGGATLKTLLSGGLSLLNLALLFVYSWQLALIAVGVLIANLGVTTFASASLLRHNKELVELRAVIRGVSVQLIQGVSKLRVSGAEGQAFAYWAKRYARQQAVTLRVREITDLLAIWNTTLVLGSTILFYGAASALLHSPEGGLSVGAFLAFSAAFGLFLTGARALSNTIASILEVINLAEHARPILEATPEVDLSKADPGVMSGKLAVERVTFRYRPDGAHILEDVSVHANPGEFIALVGGSGSGKSTLLRILLGFEEPEAGSAFYDDQDLSGLDLYAVRRQIGVVLQSGRISSGSIFKNIAGGSMVSLSEAWEAARAAGLAEDIEDMPMGMHTVLSEGASTLSGGQRQRLLIARALVSKPSMLFLDEATSALDNRTQQIVSESMDALQVTRVVIAHRLSTIRQADRIYVLERGRVAQVGTYDELAAQEGHFQRLVQRQSA